jgi:hypothetical protein
MDKSANHLNERLDNERQTRDRVQCAKEEDGDRAKEEGDDETPPARRNPLAR